jgi:hypothetical protein
MPFGPALARSNAARDACLAEFDPAIGRRSRPLSYFC